MIRLAAVSILVGVVVGSATRVEANGRPPATSSINFQKGAGTNIVGGMTFGVVFSQDGGATWTWACEDAVGYGGNYDPDYAITSNGTLFATTFDGLKVNKDGCVYEPSTLSPPAPAIKFFSTIAVGPDDAIYAAAADPLDGFVYKSTDGGETFPTKFMPGELGDWWQTMEVAPGDPNIIYLTGYRLKSGMPRRHLLHRSSDGGATFTPLPGNGESDLAAQGITVMPNSTVEIVGINKTDPNLVYARVTLSDNTISDTIYRSTDGGQSWQKILEKRGSIAFVARANGELVAGTQVLGAFKATDTGGATLPTFTEIPNPPHINCLAENAAGVVYACTQNYGTGMPGTDAGIPTDGAGIMTSTDLVTWTPALRFQDLVAPVNCPAGTIQKDRCDVINWCPLCSQLGCEANRDCAVSPGDSGGTDGPQIVTTDPTGCCQSGSGGVVGMVAIAGIVGMVTLRRRRRR